MGYASDAQRKAVHADKADGGKGHPDNKKTPATMTGKERRQKNRADVKKAKQGKSGKEKRQAARAERKKQRAARRQTGVRCAMRISCIDSWLQDGGQRELATKPAAVG